MTDLPIPFTRAFAMRGSGRLFARLAKGRAIENLLSLAIAGAGRQVVLSRLRNAANAAARTVGDATSDGRPDAVQGKQELAPATRQQIIDVVRDAIARGELKW